MGSSVRFSEQANFGGGNTFIYVIFIHGLINRLTANNKLFKFEPSINVTFIYLEIKVLKRYANLFQREASR